jgi:hypothetical protein
MKHWIITAAALTAMAMPVLGQNATATVRRDAGKDPAARRLTGIVAPSAAPQDGLVVGEPGQRLADAAGNILPVNPAKIEKMTYLGVITSGASAAMRAQLNLGKGVGLVVDSVEPNTAAATAGIQQHDVLEKLNDQLLINTEQLTALLRTMKTDDEVTLTVLRKGERQSIKAKLGEKQVNTATPPEVWPALPLQPGMGAGENEIFLGGRGNAGGPVIFNKMGDLGTNVLIRRVNGKQTTNWADDEFSITLERDGGQTTGVTVYGTKTGKLIMTGPPPAADNPVLKTLPQLEQKLKRAEEAATAQPPGMITGQFLGPATARGKVSQWQDGDHIFMMRVMGNKPIYLLALSKKDGRTLYDGPVMTDEQRKSIPAEVSEQFELLLAHPEQIKEFGAREAKK